MTSYYSPANAGGLSPFAVAFVRALSDARPYLFAYVTRIPHDADAAFGVRVTIPNPTADGSPLWVEAVDNEIEMGFDLWETLHGPFAGESTAEEAITGAVAEIIGILDERIGIVLAVGDDDHCVAAWTCHLSSVSPTDDWYKKLCVRSWRRTYDSGWTLPWPWMDG